MRELIARAIYGEMDLDSPTCGFEWDHSAREEAMRQADAVVAALTASGHVIAPMEATEAMQDAYTVASDNTDGPAAMYLQTGAYSAMMKTLMPRPTP